MRQEIMINIADFSAYPSGRDEVDGDYNGTRFRTDYLLPAITEALDSGDKVIVTLDNVKSMGSSFLEEAFGGLVRKEQLNKGQIKSVLEIRTERPSFSRYVDAIWRYIDIAK
jgi:hypothetical protein